MWPFKDRDQIQQELKERFAKLEEYQKNFAEALKLREKYETQSDLYRKMIRRTMKECSRLKAKLDMATPA